MIQQKLQVAEQVKINNIFYDVKSIKRSSIKIYLHDIESYYFFNNWMAEKENAKDIEYFLEVNNNLLQNFIYKGCFPISISLSNNKRSTATLSFDAYIENKLNG